MTPFEVLYGYKCRAPFYWDNLTKTVIIGPKLAQNMATNHTSPKKYESDKK